MVGADVSCPSRVFLLDDQPPNLLSSYGGLFILWRVLDFGVLFYCRIRGVFMNTTALFSYSLVAHLFANTFVICSIVLLLRSFVRSFIRFFVHSSTRLLSSICHPIRTDPYTSVRVLYILLVRLPAGLYVRLSV